MNFSLSTHHGPRYLMVIGSGVAGVADLCGACDFAAGAGRLKGNRKVVADFLAVDMALSDEDRRALGAYSAERFQGFAAVAIVMPAQFWNGVAEDVARGKGLNVSIFHTLEEATDWLDGFPA